MLTFCTIISADYLPFAKVLHCSLKKYDPDISLQVLVIGQTQFVSGENFVIHTTDSIINSPVAKNIYKKYAYSNPSYLRWALKPTFISHLLQAGFSKVIYTDADILYVSNFIFLFEELDSNQVILTPHWGSIKPLEDGVSLTEVLKGGLFNAGFIGATQKGRDAIDWWAEMCHFKTEDNTELGLYFDQKYLDVFPVQFPGVKILTHKGCNLASWNIETCKREIIDGKLMINQKFEPVFIHFNSETIANILNGNDKLLNPYLEDYIQLLKSEGFDFYNNNNFDFSKFNSPFLRLKHKLLLRTRLKRFLFKLAEKL